PGPGGTGFGPLHPLGNRVLFAFANGGGERYRLGASAGDAASTGLVAAIHRGVGSSDPHALTALGGRMLLVADDGTHGREVWTSNGTRLGTALLGDLHPGPSEHERPTELTAIGGRLFFSTGFGTAVWTTQGVPGDARRLRGRQRFLHSLVGLGHVAIFFGSEYRDGELSLVIWRSDGTPQGTRRVETVARTTNPSDIGADFFATATSDGARVYFTPHYALDFIDRVSGLWVTDGTAAGTFEAVADPCDRCTFVASPHLLGQRLVYLTESDVEHPRRTELWTSDLTPAGTLPLLRASFIDGPIQWIRQLVTLEFGERAFFVASDFARGEELWTSDGTPEGTRLVADLRPGPDSAAPAFLTPRGDHLFFAADDGVHGREPWVSDGTAEGTRMLRDIRPGQRSSHPQALRTLDGTLVFAADDGTIGLEPWQSDGTFAGTRPLGDVLAGPLSSSPRDFAAAGEWLLFNAGRPAAGYELFRLPRALLGPAP
ncbi:MAG: ELWxxDGT repeat protein, partial [Thermoanaerobaculia bacterium]